MDIMSILNEHKQLKHVRFRNIYWDHDRIFCSI